MKTLTVIGRLWTRPKYGGMYGTAQIIVDGKTVYKTGRFLGGGSYYEQMASYWLENNGFIKPEHYANSGQETLWQCCERMGVYYERFSIEVALERDL